MTTQTIKTNKISKEQPFVKIAIGAAISISIIYSGNNPVSAVVDSASCIKPGQANIAYYSPGISHDSFGYISTEAKGGVLMYKESCDQAENFERLDKMLALEENWDGYGASVPSPALIAKAKGLISVLPVQPEVFLTGLGSIQLEYEKDNGDYLEFELFEDGRLKAFKLMSDGTEDTKTITLDTSQITEVIGHFFE